jgi:hypothetical protein
MTIENDRQQLDTLTQDRIRYHLDKDTFEQAQHYLQQGCVREPAVVGTTLRAIVQPDEYTSHWVEFSVEGGEMYTSCTCDHRQPGMCAHVAALLLAWVDRRDEFGGEEHSALTVLSNLLQQGHIFEDEYRELLAERTINDLRAIAQRRGIDIGGTRKDPIVQELAAGLCDPDRIRLLISELDQTDQDLLTYLHLTLSAGYGITGENLIGGLTARQKSLSRRILYERLQDLTEQGLLLRFDHDSVSYYVLPQIVRACLPPRPGFIPPYTGEGDQLEIRERPATAIIHSLYAVWSYIVAQTPRLNAAPKRQPVEDQWPQLIEWNHIPEEIEQLTQRHRSSFNMYNTSITVPPAPYRLRNADRQRLREQTNCSEQELEFCYVILSTLNAVEAEPGHTISYRQEVFEHILSLPPSLQMYVITYTWIYATTWSEMDILLRSANDIRLRRNLAYSTFKPENLYEEWFAGRQTVLRYLSTIQEGEWVSVQGLLKTIFTTTPNMLHNRTDASVWWLESRKTKKQFGTTYEDWQDSRGQFVLAMLKGPLSWLGAVTLGYKGDQLVAFKITPTGSFILQRRSSIAETESQAIDEDAIQFKDDLTVVLRPGHAPAQLQDLLHLLGTLEETTPERFVYRITAEGILLALEQGQTVDQLFDRIAQWSQTEIPEAWREKVHAWSENYGKLHIYDDIALIEMADEYVLRELLSNTCLEQHLIYQFSPRLIAIQPDAVDNLVEEMEKRGYTPHVE